MFHKIAYTLRISVMTVVFCLAAGNAYTADKTGHADHGMVMHHMHMMLNHAVELATKGSNLVMVGEMGMAGEIDTISIEEGKALIADAKVMVNKVMKSDTMKNMHLDGVTGTNDAMAHTHHMGDAAMKYIELLEGMSASMKHH